MVSNELMQLHTKSERENSSNTTNELSKIQDKVFSKDYVDFLNEAGWILEKKLPSTIYTYSDLLEDTEWNNNLFLNKKSRHYRRDLDALS